MHLNCCFFLYPTYSQKQFKRFPLVVIDVEKMKNNEKLTYTLVNTETGDEYEEFVRGMILKNF